MSTTNKSSSSVKPKNIIVTKSSHQEIVHLESIPEEHLKYLRVAFESLDTDGSGHIGISELMHFMEGCGHPISEEEVKETFFKDDNGDFELTFEEFAARMASREKIYDDEVIAAFKHFNGKLRYMDVGQLKHILTQMGGAADKFSEEDFQCLLRETGQKMSDKFDYELYVKDWRSKMEAASEEAKQK